MARTVQPAGIRGRLARLDYRQACKLLGTGGDRLITAGNRYDMIDIERDVYLRGDLFRLTLRGAGDEGQDVRVAITLMASRQKRLRWNCDHCEAACAHVGAAFGLILEDKYSLGLSDIPKEGVPAELLEEGELAQRALAERLVRARDEPLRLRSSNPEEPWTDYVVTNHQSGKSYRVALRGEERGQSYCSCPDFRTNTLGTCKHILYVLQRVEQKFSREIRSQPFQPTRFAAHLRYGKDITLWLETPRNLDAPTRRLLKNLAQPIEDLQQLLQIISRLEAKGHDVLIYPDAEKWIQQRLLEQRLTREVDAICKDPASHPLRKELLKSELLPYQLEGIAFAVGRGRAVLADDMGLGKTVQGIGTAELLARLAQIERVLVVCPASVKSQWRSEIQRFSDRPSQIVIGTAEDRAKQYEEDVFFTICNYEQVLRDFNNISPLRWDLIILDEGQRIKNWESKTSNVIKSLNSPFALVLSGTPLENRLDELYSVVQFIDDRRLPPAFRFFHRHRVVDDKGKVIGYKNLDQLRENLKPVLLRRTRAAVLKQLPERSTEVIRITPTIEQKRISDANLQTVAQIAGKKFISEMDLLKMQKALLIARMACDSTYLVDKEAPGFSSKLEHLDSFCQQLFSEPDRKAVLFSEWTTMLDLIEPILEKHDVPFVRLDGSVPQRKRQVLVNRFQNDADCKVFITTNAGATGLNLQTANTVINVDLPWNPAVLEQRIARAHRMGQRQPVDVYLLVTTQTIEERILNVLGEKQELAMAALDVDSNVTAVDFNSGIEAIKRRLELLLGDRRSAPIDRSSQIQAEREVEQFQARRERVAAAGGEMLGAVFHFLGELVDHQDAPPPPENVVAKVRNGLTECTEEDAEGRQQLSLTLPNREALDQLANTLAKLLASGDASNPS